MADKSAIEWTDATWPVVQGCDPVSQGCANCYAVPLLWRMAHDPDPKISGPLQGLTELHVNASGERILRFTGKIALREDRLDWPLKWKQPRMIFVPSHGDLFHKDVPDEFIDNVFARMTLAHWHTFQVLTKRDKRMLAYLSHPDRANRINGKIWSFLGTPRGSKIHHGGKWQVRLPLPNVWLGVSCERQQEADERIPHMLQTPAAVRFVSAEPLLEPIKFHETLGDDWLASGKSGERRGLDWVIVGGESGPHAREHDLQWSRDLIAQCTASGVAVFVKQLGANVVGPHANGVNQTTYKFTHGKGGDWSEWPTDLRVREFPKTESASVIEGSMPHDGISSPDPNQKEAARS